MATDAESQRGHLQSGNAAAASSAVAAASEGMQFTIKAEDTNLVDGRCDEYVPKEEPPIASGNAEVKTEKVEDMNHSLAPPTKRRCRSKMPSGSVIVKKERTEDMETVKSENEAPTDDADPSRTGRHPSVKAEQRLTPTSYAEFKRIYTQRVKVVAKTDVKDEVKSEPKEEPKVELTPELKREIKEEIKKEIDMLLKQETKDEVKEEEEDEDEEDEDETSVEEKIDPNDDRTDAERFLDNCYVETSFWGRVPYWAIACLKFQKKGKYFLYQVVGSTRAFSRFLIYPMP